MDAKNNRREPRVKAEIPVTLRMPRGVRQYVTANISYRGIFILSTEPLPLRKLVRFEATLREGEEPLLMLGLVAHRINRVDAAERQTEPGMGLQLFGSSPECRERWRDYVRERYDRDPSARQQVRMRELPHLRMRFNKPQDIVQLASEAFPRGPVLVRSAELHPAGSHLLLDLIHPGNGQVLSVETIVYDVNESRAKRGMRVTLAEPQESIAQIVAFASS
jgi:hypothetical protein